VQVSCLQIDHRWYAVRVKSNRESIVAAGLQHRGFEEFLPSYKTRRVWSDRVKDIQLPLFPGYVFCRLNIDLRLTILQIPGVVSFVEFGRGPKPVEDHEIEALQAIVNSGVPVAPWPFLEAGQRVRIERGSLRNLEGRVVEVKNRLRVVVSVSLLQRSVAVEVDRDSVSPIGLRRPPASVTAASLTQTIKSPRTFRFHRPGLSREQSIQCHC
jgi:transcription antitermination factor NusG